MQSESHQQRPFQYPGPQFPATHPVQTSAGSVPGRFPSVLSAPAPGAWGCWRLCKKKRNQLLNSYSASCPTLDPRGHYRSRSLLVLLEDEEIGCPEKSTPEGQVEPEILPLPLSLSSPAPAVEGAVEQATRQLTRETHRDLSPGFQPYFLLGLVPLSRPRLSP